MTLEEKSLIEKAKLGDESALNLLIKNHAPVVFNTAVRILQNESEAEDVLQETFIIFIEKIGSFEGRSSLSTWLYRVATNVAIGKIRAKKKEGSIVELDVLDHEPLTGHELRSWPEEIEKM
ncbi:MAG: sigma-70 family RNA polymerase sigma factor, partial [Candidatus Marinimicrobia bacterium]|nr:sigma-70 family RNA polymerase sigma factor [Candidatus Neomarinimicrobiota bacterium]